MVVEVAGAAAEKRSSEKACEWVQWPLCSTSCYTYSTSQGGGGVGGRARPHNRSVSSPMTPAQLQTDTQNRHTTHFLGCVVRTDTADVPRCGSAAAAKWQQLNTWHHTWVAREMQTNEALTFDLTPLESLDCFFMKSGLLFDFMMSSTQRKGKIRWNESQSLPATN